MYWYKLKFYAGSLTFIAKHAYFKVINLWPLFKVICCSVSGDNKIAMLYDKVQMIWAIFSLFLENLSFFHFWPCVKVKLTLNYVYI